MFQGRVPRPVLHWASGSKFSEAENTVDHYQLKAPTELAEEHIIMLNRLQSMLNELKRFGQKLISFSNYTNYE